MPHSDPDPDAAAVLPLAAERLAVGKRRVVTGRLRLRVETLTEETPVSALLEGERIEVTRVPVDREVTTRPEPRTEGDVTIFPVLEEVLVVERRLILREEIHLRRIPTTETVETSLPLRRQQAVVERDAGIPHDTTQTPTRTEETDDR